ncbi:MAG: response regulator transcription factor [Planctomycetota bacterium]|jgi:DNA-binding CsgD family transcriptional regulator
MPLPSEPINKDKTENVNPSHSLYMQPDVVLLDEKQWRYVQRRYRISPRELEVAKLVCRGFVNGDVAKKLNVKPGTVKTHLRSIFAKTHAKNRIIMLLRFMHDANEFFSESPHTTPVPVTDAQKPNKEKPASGEKLGIN